MLEFHGRMILSRTARENRMKWFWTPIAVSQIALLTAYAVWAASADYFVEMPASVSGGCRAARRPLTDEM